jgi:hypothetical protein
MPEPRNVKVNYDSNGPGFEDLARGMTPDEKHRYTQQRQMRQELYDNMKRGKATREETEGQFNKLRTMFEKPGTDEGALFDLAYESETDTEVENPTPFGKEFGSGYASKEAAAARMTPAPPKATPAKGYADLNSRPVGISERTFYPPTPKAARAKAATSMLKDRK